MVAQTTMNGTRMNGSAMPSAAARATRNASTAVRDVLTLAELQWLLLSADYHESKRRFTTAAAAVLLGVLMLVAALPIALLALASLLVSAGFSAAAAYGLVALAATFVAGAAVLLGCRMARSALDVFSRSRNELTKNVDTICCLFGSRDRCMAD
jgi:Putative Actinobacterial Holin-X, holin superfamily III